MKCPGCGADESGAFCSKCGTRLDTALTCTRCGGTLPPDARYCIHCGARADRGRAALRWMIPAAVAVVALAAGYWLGNRDEPAVASTAAAPFAGSDGVSGRTPPPLTGTPRDQADRLFERIMQARARGDSAEVQFFLPMALQAYQNAGDLDPDGLFHLALLQLEGGMMDDVVATAERIGELDEGHLFGLAIRAEEALARGDSAAARAAFSNYLERFENEIGRELPEYQLHRPALDEYRAQAVRLTS